MAAVKKRKFQTDEPAIKLSSKPPRTNLMIQKDSEEMKGAGTASAEQTKTDIKSGQVEIEQQTKAQTAAAAVVTVTVAKQDAIAAEQKAHRVRLLAHLDSHKDEEVRKWVLYCKYCEKALKDSELPPLINEFPNNPNHIYSCCGTNDPHPPWDESVCRKCRVCDTCGHKWFGTSKGPAGACIDCSIIICLECVAADDFEDGRWEYHGYCKRCTRIRFQREYSDCANGVGSDDEADDRIIQRLARKNKLWE